MSKSQITENDSDLFVDLAAKITQGLEDGLLLFYCSELLRHIGR